MSFPVAASTYLNSAPLVYSLNRDGHNHRCKFIGDAAPARCADMLAQHQVCAALIPSIEYQRIANLRLVPDIAVAASERVRSVILVSRVPIEQVHKVALDTSSRTSATLVRILLEQFYHRAPVYTPTAPSLTDMLELNDAALLIGDPAMTVNNQYYQVYDLAAEWRKATNLPFVFAFWAIDQAVANASELVTILQEAKQIGLAARAQLAAEYQPRLQWPLALLMEYLTENINYDLNQQNIEGLTLFYKMAAEMKLIDQVEPLRMVT